MKEVKALKKNTTIRLPIDLIERLKAEAEKEGRSFNNLVERKLVAS